MQRYSIAAAMAAVMVPLLNCDDTNCHDEEGCETTHATTTTTTTSVSSSATTGGGGEVGERGAGGG